MISSWKVFVNAIPYHLVVYPTLMFLWFFLGVGTTISFFFVQTLAYLVGALIGAFFFAWVTGRNETK